jgi:hypothetical protein
MEEISFVDSIQANYFNLILLVLFFYISRFLQIFEMGECVRAPIFPPIGTFA